MGNSLQRDNTCNADGRYFPDVTLQTATLGTGNMLHSHVRGRGKPSINDCSMHFLVMFPQRPPDQRVVIG